ncbi:MAG: FAD-binding protein [Betaproteobacteria bacterium]|nr:FAD-binding protein [Betaproteobacteria bacterium]
MKPTQEHYTDIVIIGFGGAGACAAIAAHEKNVPSIILEKQPRATHASNTRMSGGGFHSPAPDGDYQSIKAYAKAMFSGENLPQVVEGAQPEFSDALADAWAQYAPHNQAFMQSLDPQFKTFVSLGAAFEHFPGADKAKYACIRSTYKDEAYVAGETGRVSGEAKQDKEAGEAFHTCLLTGLEARNIPIHYDTAARSLMVDEQSGAIIGVIAERNGATIVYHARRAVIICSGGYEYNVKMRKAFLDGPGHQGWAFYGTPANTGDGIRMALKVGAAMAKAGSVAGRVIMAIPERRHDIKLGLNTSSVGKPHEIVVDNYGRRYAAERRITKDPSRYIFWKEAMLFDTEKLEYPRIPSWMIFDTRLMNGGAIVSASAAAYNGIDWDHGNQNALRKGWILQGDTLAELAAKIRAHPENRQNMDAATLEAQVARWNQYCEAGKDAQWNAEPKTMGALTAPPYFAIPLYPGGPNTKGGIRANPRREVLDWDDQPIPRLYTAGEISSVFQFVYQGGGNLAECIVFGRIAGWNAAAQKPMWQERPARVAKA